GLRWFGPTISLQGTDAALFAANRYGQTEGFRPNASGNTFGQLVRVDSAGFLDYSCRIQTDTFKKSLFIGDSVTQGVGVPMDSSFAARLACTYLPVDNPSFIGYMIEDYERVIEHILSTQSYTDVRLFFCLNDLYYQNTKKIEVSANPILGRLFRVLKSQSFSYQWLKAQLADRPQVYFRHDLALYQSEEDLERLRKSFLSIQETCRRANVSLKVFLMPYEYQLRDPKPEHLVPQQIMSRLLSDLDIDHVDIFPDLAEAFPDSRKAFLFGDGIHFSMAGHQVVYRLLREQF
ncbi:MAG: SGNH/GDSL hydrolase family protein, partial [Bacteroidota bacterium]